MSAHFRVALHGFSDFERTSLTFCLKHAAAREPGYVQVALIADSDFIVADASHEGIAGSQTRGERLRDTLFVGDKPPLGATAHVSRPIDPERILRALDAMAAARGYRPRTVQPDIVLPLAAESRLPVLDTSDIDDTAPAAFQHEPLTVTFTDPDTFAAATDTEPSPLRELPRELPFEPPPAPPPRPAAPPAAPAKQARLSEAERAEAKAAARRASRRARLAQAAASAIDAPPDVLLLDAEPELAALGGLLEAFGFRVHRADNIAAAMAVLERTPLAAAFLDEAAQDITGIDGLDLCQRIKNRQVPLAGAVPAVMLMSQGASASGRVRAKLAGCDAFLTRPVRRGDAARAFEANNIVLPADARRS